MRNSNDLLGNNNATEDVFMKFNQFPVVRNTATTAHKLQGKSVDNVFIFEWSEKTNWAYVALSRVRELKGLYLKEKLDPKLSRYTLPDDYARWMEDISDRESSYPSWEDYNDICNLPRNYQRRSF